MSGKENSVRSLREYPREVFICTKNPFRRPGQGGRALGSSVALGILGSAAEGESSSENVGMGGSMWMRIPVSH